jgi:chorismate synthase
MNAFGRIFRISIFGESHGPSVGALVEGCPAGVTLSPEDFLPDLERRRSGKTGTTDRREDDRPSIASGLFNGRTTGAAILILFENRDVDSTAYEALMKTPRPGQADFVAFRKYGGFNDFRGGGIFSGRLTTGMVAAGVIAKKLIHPCVVEATLAEAGGSSQIDQAVREAMAKSDSIGGIVECRAEGLPVGLGEPLFDSVESLLGHLLFSIPGIKGVEFGAGFGGARMTGSAYNDEILSIDGRTKTNNSGGVNGGITNGNELFFRVAVRPTASIPKSQHTVNLETGLRETLFIRGRHDACFALRLPVIIEAATALVLADLMLIEQRISRVMTEVRKNGPERDS